MHQRERRHLLKLQSFFGKARHYQLRLGLPGSSRAGDRFLQHILTKSSRNMRKKEDNQVSIRLYFQNTTLILSSKLFNLKNSTQLREIELFLKSVSSELSRASFCARQSLSSGRDRTSARVRF